MDKKKHFKHIRIILASFFCFVILFGLFSCNRTGSVESHTKQFIGTFDTVVSFTLHTENEEEFEEIYEYVQLRFNELHRLFDIYNTYEGLNNVKTINDNAGKNPVEVDPLVIDMLLISMEWYEISSGKFNIAIGRVADIWREYIADAENHGENPPVPSYDELSAAAQHISVKDIQIFPEKNEVYLADPEMKLDVGAVAKGYAVQVVHDELVGMGYDNFAVNAGGNILVKGIPLARGNDYWIIGIRDPKINGSGNPIRKIAVTDTSIVTSGWYERYYISEGKIYHHVVDPETLFPSSHFKSVTIKHPDSTVSDILSTVLMVMDIQEGMEFVETIEGAMALWVSDEGEVIKSEGLEEKIIE